MDKKLPARPNLEHLRTQAKQLLKDLADGDKEAAASLIKHLPTAKGMTPAKVAATKFKLADAQSVIARKNGFSSWSTLVRHVDELRALEGAWEFVDLQVDGMSMPAAALGHSRMLIDGDRFRMESPEANYEGIFTINVEQTPHQIDIEFVEGPEAGNWSYGIFEFQGDALKICLGLTGASRPKDFVTTPGSGHALENLRRASRSRPKDVKGGKPQERAAAKEAAAVDASAFDLPMTPLLSELQGDWLPLKLVQNGQALEDSLLSFGSRSFTGNETKVVFGGQAMVHAKMRVDESQSPVAVDYLSLSRTSAGQISLGIMDWIDGAVRICMASPGKPRPSDFSSDRGSGRTLSIWKRKAPIS